MFTEIAVAICMSMSPQYRNACRAAINQAGEQTHVKTNVDKIQSMAVEKV